MVEGARLESVYTATYRGFESLPLRHPNRNASLAEAFLLRGRVGVLMRVLWFDKLFLWKRLDAKPQGGAPP